MKFPTASLIQFLVIFVLRSANDAQVDAAVGLYGPDRYEGLAEICLMPMDFGYCRAKVQRYYFDIRRMKCTMFFWGGCAGNDNNFKSIDECNEFCASPYEDSQHHENEVVVKKERSENRGSGNTKFINSRDNSISKSTPKFALKTNSTLKETGYKGSIKASAKSFNVNAPNITPKPINTPSATIEYDEEYDD